MKSTIEADAKSERTPRTAGQRPVADRGDRLRILHVLAPARVGGLERVVHALAAGHHGRGHRVTVLATLSGQRESHPFVEGLRHAGVDVREAWIGARSYREERAVVRELCRELAPHVVHTHGYRPDVVDGGVPRGRGIPVVTTSHGFTGGNLRGRIYEAVQRRAMRRFDAVIAVSRPMRETLRRSGVSDQRIDVLPNAWPEGEPPLPRDEARALLGLPREGFRIGWVGRVSREKGPDLMLSALDRIADLPWSASLIGNGPMLQAVRNLATASRIGDRVTIHGPVPAAGRLLNAFNLFAMSSRTEGTPIVLFEAMASGCDIVVTQVGGIPDVVSDGEAILVPPEDPVALAGALRAAITDPAAASRRSAAALRRLDDFRLDPWLDRYELLYRRLAGPSTSDRTS